ncbi:integration host factor subunit alpha [Acidithiobacillus sp. M4-SHS-6]|uniref:integration host factor subunit alpha n=1 Tax=Acidithiobacillus sp. M4-SHS-6 TaxID=3383024 RepID=UPI0039BDAD59
MTVTKAELAEHLRNSMGLTRMDASALVDTFFATMRQALASGEPVLLSGFGKFTLHDKRSRPGRNPKTGKPFLITSRRVVTFSASPGLRKYCDMKVD